VAVGPSFPVIVSNDPLVAISDGLNSQSGKEDNQLKKKLNFTFKSQCPTLSVYRWEHMEPILFKKLQP
jgi:hypothetical protein